MAYRTIRTPWNPGGDDPEDVLLGMTPPELQQPDPLEDAPFEEPGRFGGFLEDLGGTFQPIDRPANFVQGFANAFLGGLAAKGRSIGERRQKHEAKLETRRKGRDLANKEAHNRYLDWRERRMEKVGDQQRQDSKSEADLARTRAVVTAEDAKADPRLRRLVGKSVPIEYLRGPEPKEPKAAKEPELVAVPQPDGTTKYVRKVEGLTYKTPPAAGEKPKPPSAAERGELVGDIGILSQVNDIRDAYNPKFVGPVSGLVGAAATAGVPGAGIGRPGKEATFRGRLAALRNQILKLRSGGAVSDGEAQRLLEELPTERLPSEKFVERLDNFERLYRNIAETRRGVMGGTGVALEGLPGLPAPRNRPPLSAFGTP